MQAHFSHLPRPWQWLVSFLALGCLSCSSGSLHPVQGKVLYRDQPANGVVVFFHPEGADEVTAERPTGITGEDGTFTLTTGQKNGAPAGVYVVTFSWPEETRKEGKIYMVMPEPKNRLPDDYADRAKSKHKIEITKGPNQLDAFNLK